jgi:imidazolonepropionase-like amidohydrolase
MKTLYLARAVRPDWGGEVLADSGVVVEGDRILAVGGVDASTVDAVVDLGDAVLAPGFVDAHVHLHFDGGPDPVGSVQAATDDRLAELAARNAALLVSAGVTTARDLGSRGMALTRTRAAIAAGEIPGPTLLLAGSPITTPQGHCWFLGGAVENLDDALALLDRQADAGADAVKVMVSGGFLTAATEVSVPQFELPTLTALVARAHERGLRVAAHAHSTAAVRTAVEAGVDSIEHATFIGADGIDANPDVVAALGASTTAVCPTANAATADYPQEYGRDSLARVRALAARGARLLVGTDAGVAHVTGDLFAEGLLRLQAAGFSASELLFAATTGAAEILGLEREIGALRPGMRADLVAFAGDPAADLTVARHPRAVVAAGRPIAAREDAR